MTAWLMVGLCKTHKAKFHSQNYFTVPHVPDCHCSSIQRRPPAMWIPLYFQILWGHNWCPKPLESEVRVSCAHGFLCGRTTIRTKPLVQRCTNFEIFRKRPPDPTTGWILVCGNQTDGLLWNCAPTPEYTRIGRSRPCPLPVFHPRDFEGGPF